MMKKFSLFIFPFLTVFSAFSQIVVDGSGQNNDVTYLIEDVLINAGALGLDVSNITYSQGDTNQIGYFSNGLGSIGMNDGVTMSTGGIDLLTTFPPTPGIYPGPGVEDEDLKLQMFLVGMDTTVAISNTVVIEFDFEAVGNSIMNIPTTLAQITMIFLDFLLVVLGLLGLSLIMEKTLLWFLTLIIRVNIRLLLLQ